MYDGALSSTLKAQPIQNNSIILQETDEEILAQVMQEIDLNSKQVNQFWEIQKYDGKFGKIMGKFGKIMGKFGKIMGKFGKIKLIQENNRKNWNFMGRLKIYSYYYQKISN